MSRVVITGVNPFKFEPEELPAPPRTEAEIAAASAPFIEPVRAVVRDKLPLRGLGVVREAIGGTLLHPKDGDRILYFNNYDQRGVFLAQEGAWVLVPDQLAPNATIVVQDGDQVSWLTVLNKDATELQLTVSDVQRQGALLFVLEKK
jgi:hypothetical protein